MIRPIPKVTLLHIILLLINHEMSQAATLPDSQKLLASPRVTDWGEWGDFENCPENSFVMGMRLKTEPVQGPGDDTALNGVSFMCGNLGEKTKVLHSPERQIQSLSGNWGTWGLNYECPNGYAVGFQLRSESVQKHHDDTAANNIRIYCKSNRSDILTYLEGSGLRWGDWSEPQFCPSGWAMCGIKTQVETAKGHKVDDTALNNVDVKCCKLSRT